MKLTPAIFFATYGALDLIDESYHRTTVAAPNTGGGTHASLVFRRRMNAWGGPSDDLVREATAVLEAANAVTEPFGPSDDLPQLDVAFDDVRSDLHYVLAQLGTYDVGTDGYVRPDSLPEYRWLQDRVSGDYEVYGIPRGGILKAPEGLAELIYDSSYTSDMDRDLDPYIFGFDRGALLPYSEDPRGSAAHAAAGRSFGKHGLDFSPLAQEGRRISDSTLSLLED